MSNKTDTVEAEISEPTIPPRNGTLSGLSLWKRLSKAFARDYAVYWDSLGRLNSLSIVMNISAFFLTGLIYQGYYYTYYSLSLLCLVAIGIQIPTLWLDRLKYYLLFLLAEVIALYFLIASIIYAARNAMLHFSPLLEP